jgi:hypothetical protein
MFECLVVAQTIAQSLFELSERGKEPIVGRPPPQHLPLDHLELRAVARSSVACYVGHRLERCHDQGALVPGSVVDHEHDPRVLDGGIGPGDVPHVARQRRLQAALPGPGLSPRSIGCAALDEPRGELASHQVERADHIAQVMTVQIADDGPMPVEPPGRA